MTTDRDIESSVERYKKDLKEALNIYPTSDLCNDFALGLSNDKAKGYMYQGVLRRVNLLKRCIENINSICPIDSNDNIGKNQKADLVINLHAFYINIQGVLDNIAWIFIFKEGIKLKKSDVGLFKKSSKTYFPEKLTDYLDDMEDWYFKYSKQYRDCLAHRIPLYAPNLIMKNHKKYQELELEKERFKHEIDELIRIMEEQEQLLEPPKIISISDLEDLKSVRLHAQTLVDFITVKSIIEKAFIS